MCPSPRFPHGNIMSKNHDIDIENVQDAPILIICHQFNMYSLMGLVLCVFCSITLYHTCRFYHPSQALDHFCHHKDSFYNHIHLPPGLHPPWEPLATTNLFSITMVWSRAGHLHGIIVSNLLGLAFILSLIPLRSIQSVVCISILFFFIAQ